MTIRVLIVDDHAVVRTGLRLLLEREDDIEVVGEAGTATTGVRAARLEKPDVVLLDVVMPGRTRARSLRRDGRGVEGGEVLMLSMQDDPTYVREAFAPGASGYMLKEAADTELVQAMREVASGGRYVHPTLGARLAQAEVEAARRAADDPLSDREREVLRLLALGHTNQEIAKKLFISVRTAETHRAHIMQKLGLGTRAELVRYALVNGMLDDCVVMLVAPLRLVRPAGGRRGRAGSLADHAVETLPRMSDATAGRAHGCRPRSGARRSPRAKAQICSAGSPVRESRPERHPGRLRRVRPLRGATSSA